MTTSRYETNPTTPKLWQRFLSAISQEMKEIVPQLAVNAAKGGIVLLNATALAGLLVKAEGYPVQGKALVGAVGFAALLVGGAKLELDACCDGAEASTPVLDLTRPDASRQYRIGL